MMISIIYKMTHLPTSKFYIGSLKDSSRFSKYTTSSNDVSKMMIESPEDWVREVIKEFENVSFVDVVFIENTMIKEAVLSLGWDCVWNRNYVSGKGRQYSPEATEKRNTILKSEEKRKQISDSMKRYAARNPNPMQGKRHSEESRKKLRDSHIGLQSGMKGKTQSDQAREKLRTANLGKKMSDETKRKISESNKGNPNLKYWEGKKMPEEMVKRRNESIKKSWEKRKCLLTA